MNNLLSQISLAFFAVKNNLLSLKIPGLSTVTDLTLAHKELQASAWHPVEKTKKYDGLSELLSAATKLESLGALLDTLIRQKSWRSPLVLQEAGVVLGELKTTDCFFQLWKQQAVEQLIKAFQVEQKTKKELYGTNSYFC